MMETMREAVKDVLREYLESSLHEKPDSAYEHACDLADCVFYALGISEDEQDEPVEIKLPRRLSVVTVNGKRCFMDIRLRQYRSVDNPHDFRDF